ncbi:MAG: hypothetical protein ABIH72_01765 [archaeon]
MVFDSLRESISDLNKRLVSRITGGKKKQQGKNPQVKTKSSVPTPPSITREKTPQKESISISPKELAPSAQESAVENYMRNYPEQYKQEQEFNQFKQTLYNAEANRKAAYTLAYSIGKDIHGKEKIEVLNYSALTDLKPIFYEKYNKKSFRGVIAAVKTPQGKKQNILTAKTVHNLLKKLEKDGIEPVSLEQRIKLFRERQIKSTKPVDISGTTYSEDVGYASLRKMNDELKAQKKPPAFRFPGESKPIYEYIKEPEPPKVDSSTGQLIKPKDPRQELRERVKKSYESIKNILGKDINLIIKDSEENELYRGKDSQAIYQVLWEQLGQDTYPLSFSYEGKSDPSKLYDLIFCEKIDSNLHEELQCHYWTITRKESLQLKD